MLLNLDGEKSNLFEKQPCALSTNNKTLLKQNANILRLQNANILRLQNASFVVHRKTQYLPLNDSLLGRQPESDECL